MADPTASSPSEQSFETPDTVGALAELYLGNILYALELASLSLEESGRGQDAGFYRGIARRLAQAHGAAKRRSTDPGQGPDTDNSEG